MENRYEVSEEYMQHLEEEDQKKDLSDRPDRSRIMISYNGQDGCYLSELPDSQKQYVGVKKEVKTEEKGENFCQGEGIAGRDPRIDQRIHMMYDQDTLKADVSESESESDSSGESTDEDYERLILECPDLMASVEAERRERKSKDTWKNN